MSIVLILSCLAGLAFQNKAESRLAGLVAQPIPFSHKQHASTGLACMECHAGAKTDDEAGLPETRKCMFCHMAIKADSPTIQRLAAAQKSGEAIPWVRLYRVPDFVFFSHGSHSKAKVDCVSCHGPVSSRDVLAQEVSTDMKTCVNCHKERHASTSCVLCHQLGQ
jgi:formate-dependent nitrite reductase cytochrome c552 subunit